MIKKGDIVGRKSYGGDILFKVTKIREEQGQQIAELRGLDLRLIADAPISDLERKSAEEVRQYQKAFQAKCLDCKKNIFKRRQRDLRQVMKRHNGKLEEAFFEVPGNVLHIDGDEEYLEKCLQSYKELNINVRGEFIPETEQYRRVPELLREEPVDILVLTGHDGILKGKKDLSDLNSYRHSKYFVEAVRAARQVEPSRDELVIFAGACQSHYEAILCAGANFASSPKRVFIHAFDPVFIVEKVAYTSIAEKLALQDVIENTITGTDGVGGVETWGRFRLGYPKSPY
ncbi:MAG: sporulation peptidase YabG [Thermoanaerobacteraceae bacterium]|nr:sporulation peptidase YabG [Thermoanaerobacteraceae bacterium]